jgi:hypothetical protein
MTTRNSKRPSNQGLRLFSSKNPAAKESYISKNNMPLMKVSLLAEQTPEEQTKPQTFTSDENQKKVEEKGTLRMKDASKTTHIRSCFSIKKPSLSLDAPVDDTHQRDSAKKPKGKFSLAKIQDSNGGRVSSVLKNRKDITFVRNPQRRASMRGTHVWFLLILMLNILDVVQALTVLTR